jgi:hypothetical protein
VAAATKSPSGGNGGNGSGAGAQGLIVITYTQVVAAARPAMVEFWGGSFTQQGGSFTIGP